MSIVDKCPYSEMRVLVTDALPSSLKIPQIPTRMEKVFWGRTDACRQGPTK